MQIVPATTPDKLLRVSLTPPLDAEGNPTVEFSDIRFEAVADGQVSIAPLPTHGDFRISFAGLGAGSVTVSAYDAGGGLIAVGGEQYTLVPGEAVTPAVIDFSIYELPEEPLTEAASQ